MKRIYDWVPQPAQRTVTIADLLAAKGTENKFTEVTANTEAEGKVAEAAGVDMTITSSPNVSAVRNGSNSIFITGAIAMQKHPTPDDVIREAFRTLEAGADAIMTPRSMEIVSMLAREDIPVMGHLGLVPRKSSWIGGMRAVGKTADEAFELYKKFKRLEDAGAVLVEAECIPGQVMTEISRRTSLITVSLGSGIGGDVICLFQSDICGENDFVPMHVRTYAKLHTLLEKLHNERIAAVTTWRKDVHKGAFPSSAETAEIKPEELEGFLEKLESTGR